MRVVRGHSAGFTCVADGLAPAVWQSAPADPCPSVDRVGLSELVAAGALPWRAGAGAGRGGRSHCVCQPRGAADEAAIVSVVLHLLSTWSARSTKRGSTNEVWWMSLV